MFTRARAEQAPAWVRGVFRLMDFMLDDSIDDSSFYSFTSSSVVSYKILCEIVWEQFFFAINFFFTFSGIRAKPCSGSSKSGAHSKTVAMPKTVERNECNR